MKRHYFLIFLVVGSAAVVMVNVTLNLKERMTLEKRKDDVRVLRSAFNDSPNATNIEDLLVILHSRGIRLHNPIPQDRRNPCYRLLVSAPDDPSIVLIEETNVSDKRLVVRALRDGSIVVQRREPML